MTVDNRFETMCTSYGRRVDVGRLCFLPADGEAGRVIVDVPRQNPEFDTMWLALSPGEARALAALLVRQAAAAESRV